MGDLAERAVYRVEIVCGCHYCWCGYVISMEAEGVRCSMYICMVYGRSTDTTAVNTEGKR